MNFLIPYLDIGTFRRWNCRFQGGKDRFCFRAVLFTQHTHIRDNPAPDRFLWLIVLNEDRHRSTTLRCMSPQVIIGPVGYSNRFDPAKAW